MSQPKNPSVLNLLGALAVGLSLMIVGSSCSSGPPVKTEAYAKLKNQRTFEYEFPAVWKGIEEAFRKLKVTDRDPEEVSELEMRKLDHRKLETDWAYGRSNDKYQEYKVNGTPRKTFLQERYRVKLDAKKILGGVDVVIKVEEEVEKLKEDGSSAGYAAADADPARASRLLDQIGASILSAPPTQSP